MGREHNKKLKSVKPGGEDVSGIDDIKLTLMTKRLSKINVRMKALKHFI